MALSADILTDRYGTPDGHQPLNKVLPAGTTVYRGSLAGLIGTGGAGANQGQLKNEDTVASTDIILGIVQKAGSGYSNATVGITGLATVEIETGSFILASGTGADALGQTTNGATVYAINSYTVGATNGGSTRPVAGVQLSCNADDASIPTGYVAVKLGTPNSPLGGP
jgi:hypothetical protein